MKRPNSLCPRCRAFERHRLVWLYLERKTPFFTAELMVLHFAPEYRLRRAFSALPNLQYVTADQDSPLADLETDITERQALSKIMRVLKPGGWALNNGHNTSFHRLWSEKMVDVNE